MLLASIARVGKLADAVEIARAEIEAGISAAAVVTPRLMIRAIGIRGLVGNAGALAAHLALAALDMAPAAVVFRIQEAGAVWRPGAI